MSLSKDNNTCSKIFICNTVLSNPAYNTRGVGSFIKQLIAKQLNNRSLNVSSDYNNEKYNTMIFTHPPPMKNNKNIYETKTFELLKQIAITSSKKIMVFYDIIPHIFKQYYQPESDYYKFFEIAKNNYDIFLCISQSVKYDLHKYFEFNLDKMIVIYPELSKSFINEANIFRTKQLSNSSLLNYKIKTKYIVAPLGNCFRKNIHITIRAFSDFKKNNNNNNYQLVLLFDINKDSQKDIFDKIPSRDRHIINDIIFTGYVPDKHGEYINIIKNAELTLFPSLYEGFGYCILESIYLGTPVITSNISSTKELGNIDPRRILLCDPNDVKDISNKINFMVHNYDNFTDDNFTIVDRIYQNNTSLINSIDYITYNLETNNLHGSTSLDTTLQTGLKFCNNTDNVYIYNIHLSQNNYKILLNIFDINIQTRISTGGGLSGCVADSCFLNKFIITSKDIYTNMVPKDYTKIIIANQTFENDWTSITDKGDRGGYSINDINNIADQIKERKDEIKQYTEGINEQLSKRLLDYPLKFIKYLDLKKHSRICFVTPYGSDRSGISQFSKIIIYELCNYLKHIDIYTDCLNREKHTKKNISFFNIDEIKKNKNNYDEIIWVIGNSTFHTKMIDYGNDIGGVFLIHDETLYDLHVWQNNIPKYLKKICQVKVREKTHDIDYSYLCFHSIINNKNNNKYIVHNFKLEYILRKHYAIKNITTIEYPNYNFNIMDKLNKYEITSFKKKMNLNENKLNILLIGGLSFIKLPNYSFKILDKLINLGIDAELHIFYDK